MTKRFLVAIALLAGLLLPLSAQRPAPPRTSSAPARTERTVPFRVGEQLSYDIVWSSFITATAATATLTVAEKRPAYGPLAYYIVAEGRPTRLVAMLYSLYYKADTWLDASTLLPLRASVYSQEGARRENKIILFDRPHGIARYEVQAGSGGSARNLKVPPQTQDALAAVYALRATPLATGTRMLMPMTFDGNLYQVQLTVERREPLKTPMGTRPAWRITPVMLEGGKPAASPRGMVLWMSDDARRLPLKMQVELPAGQFELTMTAGPYTDSRPARRSTRQCARKRNCGRSRRTAWSCFPCIAAPPARGDSFSGVAALPRSSFALLFEHFVGDRARIERQAAVVPQAAQPRDQVRVEFQPHQAQQLGVAVLVHHVHPLVAADEVL